jgi:hypothetical protein
LKRIADGFGVHDGAKFAGFSSEVMSACERYEPTVIDRAADRLVRLPTRPHIGAVYAALDEAAAGRSAPPTQRPRSVQADVTLATAWLGGSTVRHHDFPAEFPPPEGDFPFVDPAKLAHFARNIGWEAQAMIKRLHGLTDAPKRYQPHDRFEAVIVWNLRYAKTYQAGYASRLAEIIDTVSRETAESL